MYTPKPIDVSGIQLPDSLLTLCERLAENNHEVWAQGRMAQGWTYGPCRDDAARHSPCLVPYADLPEAEKQFDRNTALETIRLLVALGYRILPPEG